MQMCLPGILMVLHLRNAFQMFVGHDVYTKKSPTSVQGGCCEVSQGTQKSIQNFK
jgi:hypothetical protein